MTIAPVVFWPLNSYSTKPDGQRRHQASSQCEICRYSEFHHQPITLAGGFGRKRYRIAVLLEPRIHAVLYCSEDRAAEERNFWFSRRGIHIMMDVGYLGRTTRRAHVAAGRGPGLPT